MGPRWNQIFTPQAGSCSIRSLLASSASQPLLSSNMPNQVKTVRVLLGFMTKEDGFSFLRNECSMPTKKDAELSALWEKYHRAVTVLPQANPDTKVHGINSDYRKQLDEISANPRVIEATKQRTWSFNYVEINNLICHQKYVDVDYANDISRTVDFTSESQIIDFCLTDRFLERSTKTTRIGQFGVAMSAEGHDLRILDSRVEEDKQTNSTELTLKVGWGVPATQVVECEGRCYLKNGYHRAFAMKNRGLRYLPCILIKAGSYSDLENPGPPGFFAESLVRSSKPPLFSHYFSDDLSARVRMKAVRKYIVSLPDVNTVTYPDARDYLSKASIEWKPREKPDDRYVVEDVQIIREDWNVYRLEDGTILKLRQLATGAVADKPGVRQISLKVGQTAVIHAIIPLKRMTGEPSKESISQENISKHITRSRLKFRALREPINEYSTSSGLRFTSKLKLQFVSGTDLYDSEGLPIYMFQTNLSVAPLL